MKGFVLYVLEGLASLLLIVLAILGYFVGDYSGGASGGAGGAIVGFVVGVLVTGVVFVLLSINEQLKRQTQILEASRRSLEAIGTALAKSIVLARPVEAAVPKERPNAETSIAQQYRLQPSESPEADPADAIPCPKCGYANRTDRNYCWSCGTRLHTES